MKLEIHRKYGLKFVLYLIRKLQNYIIGSIDTRKLFKIEEYINSVYNENNKGYISVKNIIISGAMNLTYTIYPTKFVIEINSNEIYYRTNAKLYELCKLINYGVLGVTAYPIFTESFKYINDNINLLFERYMQEEE